MKNGFIILLIPLFTQPIKMQVGIFNGIGMKDYNLLYIKKMNTIVGIATKTQIYIKKKINILMVR